MFWCHAVYFNKFFSRYFVQYTSSSAMSFIPFIIFPYFITPCTNIVGDLWIFFELEFLSILSSFLSFVNTPYRLRVSLFVSRGVVLCPVFSLPFSASYTCQLFNTVCHCSLVCLYILWVFMELTSPGISPIGNIMLLL